MGTEQEAEATVRHAAWAGSARRCQGCVREPSPWAVLLALAGEGGCARPSSACGTGTRRSPSAGSGRRTPSPTHPTALTASPAPGEGRPRGPGLRVAPKPEGRLGVPGLY